MCKFTSLSTVESLQALVKSYLGFINSHLIACLSYRRHYNTGGLVILDRTFPDWEPGCKVFCKKCNLVQYNTSFLGSRSSCHTHVQHISSHCDLHSVAVRSTAVGIRGEVQRRGTAAQLGHQELCTGDAPRPADVQAMEESQLHSWGLQFWRILPGKLSKPLWLAWQENYILYMGYSSDCAAQGAFNKHRNSAEVSSKCAARPVSRHCAEPIKHRSCLKLAWQLCLRPRSRLPLHVYALRLILSHANNNNKKNNRGTQR